MSDSSTSGVGPKPVVHSPIESPKKTKKTKEGQLSDLTLGWIKVPPSEGTSKSKAAITDKGIMGKAIRLFMQIVYGKSVAKAAVKVAEENQPEIHSLSKWMEGQAGAREERIGKQSAKAFIGKDHLSCVSADRLAYCQANTSKKPELTSPLVAHAHLRQIRSPSQPPLSQLTSHDDTKWNALKIFLDSKGNPSIEENQIHTTSERAVGGGSDLTNVYVNISPQGHLTITCGVIDSEKKAKEFMAAVLWARRKVDPSIPIRISMHQLNSMGSGPLTLVSERSLVQKQHQMVGYINRHLGEYLEQNGVAPLEKGPYVAHVNRCMNGFTHFKGEDPQSHAINTEGLAIQMCWLMDDMRAPLSEFSDPINPLMHQTVKDRLNTLQNLQQELADIEEEASQKNEAIREDKRMIDELEAKIITLQIEQGGLSEGEEELLVSLQEVIKTLKMQLHDKETELKSLLKDKGDEINAKKKEVKAAETQLKKTLVPLTISLQESLKHVQDKMSESPNDPTLMKWATQLSLGMHLLAMQTDKTETLGLRTLSPSQEMALQLLFDNMLNITSEINCKSGLDRTGFVRSLQKGIQGKLLETEKRLTDEMQKHRGGRPLTIQEHEAIRAEAVARVYQFIHSFENTVQDMDKSMAKDNIASAAELNAWLEKPGRAHYKEAYQFQCIVSAELQAVGVEITERSTGVPGLKWHHSKNSLNPFEKNPHPLPYIPKFTNIIQEDQQSLVKVIETDKKGQRSFAQTGLDLFAILESKRGG